MYGAKVIGVVVGPDGVLFEFDRAHHRGKQAVLRNEVNRVIRMVCGTIGVPEVSFPTARTLLLPGAQDARISTIAALYTLLSSTPLVPHIHVVHVAQFLPNGEPLTSPHQSERNAITVEVVLSTTQVFTTADVVKICGTMPGREAAASDDRKFLILRFRRKAQPLQEQLDQLVRTIACLLGEQRPGRE